MVHIKRVIVKPYSKDRYEVYQDYEFHLESCGYYKIPQGYITNGANIPRIFWSIFPPFRPEYFTAVVIHDYLCDLAETQYSKKAYFKEADLSLKEAMTLLEVNRFKVQLFYYSCRVYHILKSYVRGDK